MFQKLTCYFIPNMLKTILISLSLSLIAVSAFAQFNEVVLRKNGKSFKRFREGAFIRIESKLGMKFGGIINLIQNDTIYVNHHGIAKKEIHAVLKKKNKQPIIPMDGETFLWANAGIPLFAGGLTASGESFGRSLLWGTGLVYGPILLYHGKHLLFDRSRRYVLGDKYDLLMLDIFQPEIVPIRQR